VTEVYEVGGRRLGVRWTHGGLDAELRALAAGALGVEDAPANVSIVVADASGPARSKHQLHAQGHLLSLISGDGGLIRAVVRALGALAIDPPLGTLSLNASLVINPGAADAVAVDRRLTGDLQRLEPLLRRRGRRVLQLPSLHVWPDRGTAWLPDGAAAAGVPLEGLNARWPLESGDDDLAAGEVTIARLIYAGHPESASRPDAVAAMVAMVRDPDERVRAADVAQLAALTDRVQAGGVLNGDQDRFAAMLDLS
jgi:hypothetical protein